MKQIQFSEKYQKVQQMGICRVKLFPTALTPPHIKFLRLLFYFGKICKSKNPCNSRGLIAICAREETRTPTVVTPQASETCGRSSNTSLFKAFQGVIMCLFRPFWTFSAPQNPTTTCLKISNISFISLTPKLNHHENNQTRNLSARTGIGTQN